MNASLHLKVFPFCSLILLILIGSNLRLGGFPLLPALFLIPVYYWLLFRPEWLPMWSLFIVGLFYDALLGNFLGLTSLLLMSSMYIGQYARPYLIGYRFPASWGAFGLYSFLYISLYGLIAQGNFSLFVSWGYGLILYPIVTWSLSHIYVWLRRHG